MSEGCFSAAGAVFGDIKLGDMDLLAEEPKKKKKKKRRAKKK